MSDDWEESSSEGEQQPQQGKGKSAPTTRSAPAASSQPVKKPQGGKKWEGEDDEAGDDAPVSDWEESSDEEEEDVKPSAATASNAAPPKKKGTLKQKLAEKEAAKANGKVAHADGDDDDENDYDSDSVLDPREKARRDKEREVKADLKNAADLFGSAALGAPSASDLTALLSFQPRTKEDFIHLSDQLINLILKPHESKPLYPFFIEHHARALALPLKDVEVRKVASGLTTLSNEKQKEQRDKASGKKKVKPKNVMKPVLGSSKVAGKLDTNAYDEALDDFGTNADDFM